MYYFLLFNYMQRIIKEEEFSVLITVSDVLFMSKTNLLYNDSLIK